ncbi:PD-(D/E)XK nuclease family protein [Halorarum halobium]|uniref:PD-(D/E)XK nuclease family protein n=1 Tax=Halorarum halobium TaxID=3075121 RepID=UPI0028A91B6F|nr:PD-(D/E)XK nuclease family protein [Halobaculum sp. XH14]
MSLTRAKSLETLYAECEAFDRVLVPEAPLASALNRRLDGPQFGPFAITPRRLAAGRREESEDRLAFLAVIDRLDLPWKEAAHVVGNVLQCWEHEGSVDAILEYDAFAGEPTERVVECVADLDTTSGRLAGFSIDADTSVAVVGIDQLTALERSILPDEYETVDPFTDEPFDHSPFRILDSPAAIVDALLETVTPENADDVGVVLDAGGQYSPLVESALEAAEVPYYGGPGFADQPDHRAFLGLLRSAHAGRDTRVGDVRPLLTHLGHGVDVEHDEKRLRDLDHPGTDWLVAFAEGIESHTFGTALDEFESVTDASLPAFREELGALGILEERVTEPAVDRLAFYLETYDVPVDRENEGVLLADANTAAYVDRPLVFLLGIDEGWTRSSPRRPWVDRDREFERQIRQFQLLLQNGVDQQYLVQDTAGGTPVTPCLYFEELFDEAFERFDDLDSVRHARTARSPGGGFEREPLDVEPGRVEAISQSSLSTYVNCPRDYLFGRLVDGPDRDYFAEGNLFHDFAEFAVAHPDAVADADLDEVADVILKEVDPFLREIDREVRRTKYRVGLETIVEFLEANPPEGEAFVTADGGRGRNFFAEYYDRAVDAPHAERWFENDDLGLKGKIDLVHGRDHLIDYKSGAKSSPTSVVKRSALDPPSDRPNFQALLYLTHHRADRPDERLQFTFFHFLETLEDVLRGEADLEDCLTTVTYHPTPFAEHVAGREVFTELREDAAGDCRKTFEQVEYDAYEAVLRDHEFPEADDSDDLLASSLGRALIDRMRAAVGEYRYVENGCTQALRHLRRIRERNYFSDDLDAFEAFVDERLAEVNARRAGAERFPVEGPGGEPNYRYVDHRDCILEGWTR